MPKPNLITMKKIFTQALLIAGCCANVAAENLNFNFQNPSFLGGNPNNAAGLLNQANAQNPYKAPVVSPYEKFQKSLESAIFSKLQKNLLDAKFGELSGADAEGEFDTQGYLISVTRDPVTNVLTVTTTDKTTNAVTTFTIDAAQ